MSESQNIQKAIESEENRDAEGSSPRNEDEDKQDSENQELDASKSENNPKPRCDEPEKSAVKKFATKQLSAQPQRSLPESDHLPQLPQSKAGECDLLPVLVERLRSALELSCSSQSSEDQLPLEDSGIDSEEDLRMWASNLRNPSDRPVQEVKPKLDLKFLEELLLSDIHTALSRLQDTLKRIDVGTLTRYNSGLDPTNKLNLLRLISNLLAKLKIPEEASVPAERTVCQRRRRTDRHTIGVSTEELARARKWLENNSVNNGQSATIKHSLNGNQESCAQQTFSKSDKAAEKSFDKVKDKHTKDAINQQQSLQNKNKETDDHYELAQQYNGVTKSGSKDDLDLLDSELNKVPPTYYNPSGSVTNRHNKFMTKKAKIKRANTIDIPNYLKLQSDGYGKQNGCIALRRPIDISDKILFNGVSTVIPSFEPKTENDRKFLALISKNSDTAPPAALAPFKSFSYRQNSSVADKNWNNRFSNIKTAFDKPKREETVEGGRNKKDEDPRGLVIGALKLPYGSPKPKLNGFRHAPTSPFQKIEKVSKEEAANNYVKYGYTPKSSGGTLQAKVKIFDHQESENITAPPIPPPRTKGLKLNKESSAETKFKIMENANGIKGNITQNGNLNYHSYHKPFALKSNRSPSESKYMDLMKLRLSNSLDEDERRREEVKHKRSSDSMYQNMKRNSVSNCYEAQKRFSHPSSQHATYPVNIAEETNIPNSPEYPYDSRFDRKSKTSRVRRMTEEEIVPYESYQKQREVPLRSKVSNKRLVDPAYRGSNIRVKNVAVQTGNEPLLVTPKEERVNVDYHRQYPEKEARTLCNNVSVQTVSEDAQNYSLSNFLNDVNNMTNSNKAPVYYNRDLDYRRQSQGTPQTESVYSPVASVSSYHSVEDVPIQHQTHVSATQSPKIPYQEYMYPGKLSLPKIYTENTPQQYNNYYPESGKQNYISPNYSPATVPESSRQYVPISNMYSPPPFQATDRAVPNHNVDPRAAPVNMYSPPTYTGTIEKKIQNQDISSEGIVTRYTGAIGTIASTSGSPESIDDSETRVPHGSKSPIYVNYNEAMKVPQKPTNDADSFNEIQRHNMLQRNLIKKLQSEQSRDNSPRTFSQEISSSPISPSFSYGKVCSRKQSFEHPIENHNTQEKISMFEEKRNPSNKLHFRPVNVPLPPKTHTLHPSKLVHPKFNSESHSPIHQNVSPIDTSDEYLMTCAAKPSRSIVLSKSESWHQLAMSKGSLQVPNSNASSFQKPPKPKSPSSMRFSKQFEASSSSDNVKKMEEKIQQYFHGSVAGSNVAEAKSKKRQLHSKKNFNSLAKSHTMPHICDEKIFDDNVDVDKAFDSLFKEATRADERC